MRRRHDRVLVVAAIATTLLILSIEALPRPLIAAALPVLWAIVLIPISAADVALFAIAAVFFLVQNYICLKAGLFAFRDKDILLMPYYEPFLWGFYFLTMKRFVSDAEPPRRIDWKVIVGVAVTSVVFSAFGDDSRRLLVATSGSTLLLLALFHTTADLGFAVYSLALGFVIELFGVSTGLWNYPAPDFLGMPFWFATMWISVGLLVRRFAMPAASWIAAVAGGQRV